MTNGQIKEWLEWFEKVIPSARGENTEHGYSLLYYFGNDSTRYIAHGQGLFFSLYPELQLVLQEEIAKRSLRFELNTYDFNPCVEIGYGEHETLASCEAGTILEAFMLAFREALEATHGS